MTAHLPARRLWTMGVLLSVVAVLGSVLVPPPTAWSAPHPELAPMANAYVFHLNSGHRARSYLLHVPPAAASGTPLPLVLNLAGATQNGRLEELQTAMDSNADSNGYLVAYPNGTRISTVLTPDPVAKQAQYGFNAGECCGLPVTRKVNDVGFLLQVISDVAARTPTDLRRVYVTGISNGGMMAYAMAAEASNHIAAIASVSGQVELPTIHPTRSVPTMEFHSVDDPIAKYKGTPNTNPKLVLSVQEGINQWVRADGCRRTPQIGKTIVGPGPSRKVRRRHLSPTATAGPVPRWPCGDSRDRDTSGRERRSTQAR